MDYLPSFRPNNAICDCLAELKQVELPEPATHAWVSIAGELYLAAYYPNIGHRALYPLSRVEVSPHFHKHP
ncbi:hypothetical protein SAMN05444354_106253 [Stigmatella aurantiaca]|uniref:Uncharacterized protein n=1 Tax=Stigmatella aurantiaca TaxID=41 RepID=A0A1H7QS76_STIAU|nr:hypothetical protein SAMN05444354_106253 [Stigmatella aurantiaca]